MIGPLLWIGRRGRCCGCGAQRRVTPSPAKGIERRKARATLSTRHGHLREATSVERFEQPRYIVTVPPATVATIEINSIEYPNTRQILSNKDDANRHGVSKDTVTARPEPNTLQMDRVHHTLWIVPHLPHKYINRLFGMCNGPFARPCVHVGHKYVPQEGFLRHTKFTRTVPQAPTHHGSPEHRLPTPTPALRTKCRSRRENSLS